MWIQFQIYLVRNRYGRKLEFLMNLKMYVLISKCMTNDIYTNVAFASDWNKDTTGEDFHEYKPSTCTQI